ncbi:hypothetical protein JK628_02770 [Shewanella sp. KX20019]|uniref:hypothetical protein n=1 Tax=Shewanella sp. KX20019 TaxID=2803864 RepID=UPI00192974C6|nr:hypothetical protein [Shewanella sp. KX20019]QQX80812.1 hypothetical protein JK628_02770 [Shewanella sp. KX20019]
MNMKQLTRKEALEIGSKSAIAVIKKNLKADFIEDKTGFDETLYPTTHLLLEDEGFEPPNGAIVDHYLNQLKDHNPELSDAKIAAMLGLAGNRRIRAFRSGERDVPFSIWRKILIMMGKVPNDAIKVIAIFE